MAGTNPDVDAFFDRAKAWGHQMRALRAIVLDCGLTEELKWRQPCYTLDGANVAIISSFKANCIVGFFKGALLADPEGLLAKPGDNTRAARQLRFTDLEQIAAMEPALRAFVRQAIEVERAGLKVDMAASAEIPVPDELRERMDESSELSSAFFGLTPGRQREYLLHFSAPKLSATRASRVEKLTPRILSGRGLRDR